MSNCECPNNSCCCIKCHGKDAEKALTHSEIMIHLLSGCTLTLANKDSGEIRVNGEGKIVYFEYNGDETDISKLNINVFHEDWLRVIVCL